MTWTISGVTVTDDSVRKMIRHDRALREAAQELAVEELKFSEASTTRLERKHRVDEVKAKLRRLAEQGPDAEQPELPLFNDDDLGGDHE